VSSADFKMIPPIAVTDAILTSTTVPEAVAATYSGATTYALGDRAGLAAVYGSPQIVYQSLQAANTGHAQSDPAWWKVVGNVYPPYASGSSCGVGGIVSSISANVHLLYQSLVTSNTGNALTDATKWLQISNTNAWAMFDAVYGSQTINADTIVAVVTPGAVVNSVFLGNLDASSVTVAQSVSGYSSTQLLNSHPVLDWYSWYYDAVIRKANAVFTDVPPYAASALTITVDNTGSTAKCGLCVISQSVTLGTTQWEVLGGIVSYSSISTDTFGNTTFVRRANTKRLNLEVHIPDGFESEAFRLLTLYTDMPMVFIGSSDYEITMAYGYLGSWQVPVSNSGKTAPIEIKGLI